MRPGPSRAVSLLAAPLLIVSILFFVPLAMMAGESFLGDPDRSAGVSLAHYARFFSDSYYITSLWVTFLTALAVTAIAIVVAYPVALVYWRARRPIRAVMLVLLLAPFYLSMVVKVFGWMLVLAPGGIVNALLLSSGALAAPIDMLNGYVAIVMVSVHRCLPFVVLLLATAMGGIDDEVLESAQLCGASPRRVFRSIILPLSMPGVVASAIVGFSLTASGFVIPRLVGGAAGAQFAPVLLYRQIAVTQNWPFAAAIGVVLLVASIVTIGVGARLARTVRAGRILSDSFVQ